MIPNGAVEPQSPADCSRVPPPDVPFKKRPWSLVLGIGFASWIAWLGCHGSEAPQERAPEIPLSELASGARVHRETPRVDLGTESVRGSLGSGWSWNETGGPDGSFVWASAKKAEIQFFLTKPQDLELQLMGFSPPDLPDQTVELELNDEPIDSWQVTPDAAVHQAILSAGQTRRGVNRLILRHDRLTHRAGRDLGAGWAWASGLGHKGPITDSSAFSTAGTQLRLAAGAGVDLYLPPGTRGPIVLEELRLQEGTEGLWVHLESEVSELESRSSMQPEQPTNQPAEWRSGRLVLNVPATPGPHRLRFIAVSGDDRGPSSGASWRGWISIPPRLSNEPVDATTSGNVQPPPLVLLYVIDTLRADRLGPWGGPGGLTPHLDRLAEQADLYTDATAQSSWTKASTASILTGVDPLQHGIREPDHRLPERLTTLAESFSALGFSTGAFTANAYLTAEAGFSQGFDTLHFEAEPCSATQTRALRWLDQQSTPRFLWVHTIDPHAPYDPSLEARTRFASEVAPRAGSVTSIRRLAGQHLGPENRSVKDLRSLYDAEVADADACFGAFRQELEARGIWDDALVVFTSDHGEAFGERGALGHGWDLHHESLQVPLLIKGPYQAAPRRLGLPVQHLDLPTLIRNRLDPEVPPTSSHDRVLISHLDYEGRHGLSVIWGRYKLIEPRSRRFGKRRLFDRFEDPTELHDLSEMQPLLAGWLASKAREAEATAREPESGTIDREQRAALEALGYL